MCKRSDLQKTQFTASSASSSSSQPVPKVEAGKASATRLQRSENIDTGTTKTGSHPLVSPVSSGTEPPTPPSSPDLSNLLQASKRESPEPCAISSGAQVFGAIYRNSIFQPAEFILGPPLISTGSLQVAIEDHPRLRKKRSRSDSELTKHRKNQHRYMKHQYHDHAGDPNVSGTGDKTAAHLGFPFVLHDILDGADSGGWSRIISWQAHGRAFQVHDTEAFLSSVMPRFFKQRKMSSFQRQLNLYDFKRLNAKGLDKGAYYHEFFLRGRRDLCARIERVRVKGTGVRVAYDQTSEPPFYDMRPVGFSEHGSTTTSALENQVLDVSDSDDAAALPLKKRAHVDNYEPEPRPLPPPFNPLSVSSLQDPIASYDDDDDDDDDSEKEQSSPLYNIGEPPALRIISAVMSSQDELIKKRQQEIDMLGDECDVGDEVAPSLPLASVRAPSVPASTNVTDQELAVFLSDIDLTAKDPDRKVASV